MWIFTSNAFLSIVHKDCDPDELLVRARRRGDIKRVFPGVKVERTPGNDYLFRARVKRDEVGRALAELADDLDYDNFKNSLRDNALHSAASCVWGIMASLQPVAPYSRSNRRQRGLL